MLLYYIYIYYLVLYTIYMSIQYIHRVSEKLAPDLGLSEKLPPSPIAPPHELSTDHNVLVNGNAWLHQLWLQFLSLSYFS